MTLTFSRLNRLGLMLLLCAGVIGILGCGKSKDSLHEMDHVTPQHWPSSLSDAAEKIRERLSMLQVEPAGDGTSSNPDPSTLLKELSDLVGWVPEVAADTDLAEQDWNKLYAASEVARKQLLRTKSIHPALANDIEALCVLLTEAQTLLPKASDEESPALTDAVVR